MRAAMNSPGLCHGSQLPSGAGFVCGSPKDDKSGQTLPLMDQFLTHCLCSGMKTWPGFLFKRPRNFTASWVWFWTTVWRTGSPTTPRAAGICRPSRSSPLSATLLLTQKTGGGSCPSTWCSSLKLPASHFWSSSVTRPSSTPENWGTFHTLWWKTEHFTLYRLYTVLRREKVMNQLISLFVYLFSGENVKSGIPESCSNHQTDFWPWC